MSVVVGYHAFPGIFPGGFVGVDVFFVISGFLITELILRGLERGRFDLLSFYERRVRRIVPALLVVLVACCLFGWFALLPSEWRWLGQSVAWCAPFLANIYFAHTGSGYFDRATGLDPLLHLWSLGVEEQFYLVWPVLMTLAVRFRVVRPVLGAVLGTSLAIAVWGGWYNPAIHFYLPGSRAWELSIGAMLAAWPTLIPTASSTKPMLSSFPSRVVGLSRWRPTISVLGMALICGAVLLLSPEQGARGTWTVIPTVGAALLIGAGSTAPVNRLVLCLPAAVFLGRISYPLYLWHWPIFSFIRIVIGHAPSIGLTAGAIVASLVAAYATYRWVEAPLRFGYSRRSAASASRGTASSGASLPPGGRGVVPALLAGLVSLTLLGVTVHAQWLRGRLSGAAALAWDQASTDWPASGNWSTDEFTGVESLTVPSGRRQTVLFVGDSHLQQYLPRVTSLIDEHPQTARSALFATIPGCPPLPGIQRVSFSHECVRLFDHAWNLSARPEIDTVVFGAFWEKYLLGEYPGGAPLRICSSVNARGLSGELAAGCVPLRLDSPQIAGVLEVWASDIAELVAHGRRVFIILSNPTSPLFDPDSLLPSAARLSLRPWPGFDPTRAPPAIELTPFESFVAPVSELLQKVARRSGARLADPLLSVCDGAVCPALGSDGLPLYLDSNHLRGAAARQRATFIDEMLFGDRGDQPGAQMTSPLR